MNGPNDWASVVDGKPDDFLVQISKNLVTGLEQELLPAFSQVTPTENIAIKMTIMDACKKFFSFKCGTDCGFPSITLEGSEQDWLNLRENAEKLILNRCKKDFAQWWSESLLPLLDKILEERKNVQSGQEECD